MLSMQCYQNALFPSTRTYRILSYYEYNELTWEEVEPDLLKMLMKLFISVADDRKDRFDRVHLAREIRSAHILETMQFYTGFSHKLKLR